MGLYKRQMNQREYMEPYTTQYFDCREQFKEIFSLIARDAATSCRIASTIFAALFDGGSRYYSSVKWHVQCATNKFDCVLAYSLVEVRIKFLYFSRGRTRSSGKVWCGRTFALLRTKRRSGD